MLDHRPKFTICGPHYTLALLLWLSAILLACLMPSRSQAAAPTPITVSAAASLKNALTEIADEFQRAHPDVTVALNFGASGTLELQIQQGAPVDVFISASSEEMDKLEAKGLLSTGSRVNLLRNELVLIAPRDSRSVAGFRDLEKSDVRVMAMGDPRTVPAGMYAQQVLTKLGLYDSLRSKIVLGTDVRQVLADVETGSAEAGLVYATDAAISRSVRIVADAPPGSHQPIVYPACVLSGSRQPEGARVFLGFLQSPSARAIFEKDGFRPVAN